MTLTNLREREEGFTLIELLVVIIIIGILAAIAIPTFLNQRNRGYDAAAKSALKNAAIAQESYFTENDAYVIDGATELTDLEGEGYNVTEGVTLQVINTGTDRYCMSAVHGSGGSTWYLTTDTGGTAPSTDVCGAV